MNARLSHALRELSEHSGPYFWREKSMQALAILGFVEAYRANGWTVSAYRITPAGREKLAEMEKMK